MHSHRKRGAWALALLVGLGLTVAAAGPPLPQARAANGDNLAQFDAAVTAGLPACSVGTGIAFDGTNLLLSCWGSNELQRVAAAAPHGNAGAVTITGVTDLGAMAYDAGRSRLWVCDGQSTVRLVDLAASAVDPAIAGFATLGCVDGLAYDGEDDTIWTSADASMTLQHWSATGTLLGTFDLSGKLGACGPLAGSTLTGPNGEQSCPCRFPFGPDHPLGSAGSYVYDWKGVADGTHNNVMAAWADVTFP